MIALLSVSCCKLCQQQQQQAFALGPWYPLYIHTYMPWCLVSKHDACLRQEAHLFSCETPHWIIVQDLSASVPAVGLNSDKIRKLKSIGYASYCIHGRYIQAVANTGIYYKRYWAVASPDENPSPFVRNKFGQTFLPPAWGQASHTCPTHINTVANMNPFFLPMEDI